MGDLYPQSLRASRKRMETMLNRQGQSQQPDLLVRAATEAERHNFAPETRTELIRLLKQVLVECAAAPAATRPTNE
jgi:hypothetical protein